MIGKLATRDSRTNGQFRPQIHQSRGRGQNRNYNQRKIRIGTDLITDQIAETEDNIDKMEAGLDMNKILEEVILGETLDIMVDKIVEEKYRNSYRNDSFDRSRNRSRERSFSRNYGNNRTRSTSNSRSRSGSRAGTNRDRIAISVGNMIILQGTVPFLEKKRKLNSSNKC